MHTSAKNKLVGPTCKPTGKETWQREQNHEAITNCATLSSLNTKDEEGKLI